MGFARPTAAIPASFTGPIPSYAHITSAARRRRYRGNMGARAASCPAAAENSSWWYSRHGPRWDRCCRRNRGVGTRADRSAAARAAYYATWGRPPGADKHRGRFIGMGATTGPCATPAGAPRPGVGSGNSASADKFCNSYRGMEARRDPGPRAENSAPHRSGNSWLAADPQRRAECGRCSLADFVFDNLVCFDRSSGCRGR